jgi:hypothetical protein
MDQVSEGQGYQLRMVDDVAINDDDREGLDRTMVVARRVAEAVANV